MNYVKPMMLLMFVQMLVPLVVSWFIDYSQLSRDICWILSHACYMWALILIYEEYNRNKRRKKRRMKRNGEV